MIPKEMQVRKAQLRSLLIKVYLNFIGLITNHYLAIPPSSTDFVESELSQAVNFTWAFMLGTYPIAGYLLYEINGAESNVVSLFISFY